jgi:ADP-ribose pyrophosphatase YjhB (NUDIX family)
MLKPIFEAARQLQAISQTGLEYTDNHFDRDRFEQIGKIAMNLMSYATGHEPSELIEAFAFEKGYATPKIDVRAAAFRDNRILLVREHSDGLWTLPGGWADVGDSPSIAAVREVKEESGFAVRVTKLAAVYDRDLHGLAPIPYHAYKLFFICDILGGAATTSAETDAVDFFDQHSLPPLSTTRVVEKQIHHMFEHYRDPSRSTSFD